MNLLSLDRNTPLAVSFSGGKDSTATVKLLHDNGFKNVTCVYAHFYFDKAKNIPATLPHHEEFIMGTLKTYVESIGYKFIACEPDTDYVTKFIKHISRGKHVGKLTGFPISIPKSRCWVNGTLKVKAIEKANKIIGDTIQVIGLAYDEQDRIERIIDNTDKFSILNELHITEEQALQICKDNNLLSPLYETASRDGCWFCPNSTPVDTQFILKKYPYLIKELLTLEISTNNERISNNAIVFKNGIPMTVEDFFKRTYKRKDNLLTENEIEELFENIKLLLT